MPDQRRTDLALAAVLMAFTAASIAVSPVAAWQIAGGLGVTLVSLVSVPMRRTRPRTALAIITVCAGAGYALQLPSQLFVWAILAFALVRGPLRSGRLLTPAVLAVGLLAGTGYWLTTGRAAEALGYGLSIGLQVAFYTLAGAVLGRISRAVRARENARLHDEERARSAAALAVTRTRIADELGGGVLDGLRRLTARTAALEPAGSPGPAGPPGSPGPAGRDGDDARAVADLERDSRDVLARMRRTLSALREQDTTEPGPEPAADRPNPWLPTRRGLALAAAVGGLALAVGALPMRPIGQPDVDRVLPLFDVLSATPLVGVTLAVQVLALAWWRSAPATAFVVGTLAAIATGTLGGTNVIIETSWMFLVYAVATGGPPRRSGPLAAAGTLAVLIAYLTVPTITAQIATSPADLVLSYLVVPFLWYAGVRRREHRLHAETLRQERVADERRELLERERLRVARELHDVVAHHVSAVAVQAGAARVARDAQGRREALGHIAESGRRIAAALPELESLTPDPGGVALTADGVDELARQVRDAGVPVTCEVHGEPADPPGDPELFAQRIVTEALTNVVRHAGASDTRVRLDHAADEVRVLVADAGPVRGHRPYRHGSGLGTTGMTERARMLGGRVDAGPSPGGGWRVEARLPRAAAPGPDDLLREEDGRVSISSSTTTRAAPGPA